MMPLLRTEKVTWRQLLKHHSISLWGLKISIEFIQSQWKVVALKSCFFVSYVGMQFATT